jgi:hypothetical protein
VVYGIRAISPLLVALVLLVVAVLRQPLPEASFLVKEEGEEEGAEEGEEAKQGEAQAGAGGGGDAGGKAGGGGGDEDGAAEGGGAAGEAAGDVEQGEVRGLGLGPWGWGLVSSILATAAPWQALVLTAPPAPRPRPPPPAVRQDASRRVAPRVPSILGRPASATGRAPSVVAAVVAAAGKADMDYYDLNVGDGDTSVAGSERSSRAGRASSGGGSAAAAGAALAAGAVCVRACCGRHSSLLVAMLMCQIGMILFNFGLTYGFSGARGG